MSINAFVFMMLLDPSAISIRGASLIKITSTCWDSACSRCVTFLVYEHTCKGRCQCFACNKQPFHCSSRFRIS